jgi:hypothetical protein
MRLAQVFGADSLLLGRGEVWPLAVQVQLGRQPAAAAPERLVLGMRDPLFASCLLGLRRAPAACWCARAMVLSTLTSHSTSPAASLLVWASASSRSQVPSLRQREKRSKQVCQGP